MKNRALSFLGILNRGQYTLIGGALLNAKRLGVLLIASDCSENSRKELLKLSEKFHCPVLEGASQEELGRSLGYETLSGIGVTENKPSKALIEKWNSKE